MADSVMREGHWLGMVKVGDKGQIVIPKAVRDLFGVKPGDNLLMMADDSRGIAIVLGQAYKKFMDNMDTALADSVLGTPPVSPD